MRISTTIFVTTVVITAYTIQSHALIGGLLPKPSKPNEPTTKAQAEVSINFFDNRKKQSKPKETPSPKHVTLGEVEYAGSGCPQGTASIALSTNARAVSIVFDQFTAQAGSEAHTSQKACRLIIPINAPQGYRMVVAQLDYRGFKGLPEKTHAQLKALHQIRHPLLNVLGPKVKSVQNFKGPDAEDFFLSATIENKPVVDLGLPVVSPITDPLLNPILKTCGGTYNLEIDAELAVKTNNQGDQVMMTLDSVDGELKEGVDFHLQWEKCTPK